MLSAKPTLSVFRAFIFIAVLTLFLFIFIQAMPSVTFHYDESHWIHTSVYLEIFTSEEASSPFWGENYWTLTQPPVTRYIIGINRKLMGFEPSQLNKAWDFAASDEENIALDRMPSPELLFASRLPMAILAAISGSIIFGILWYRSGLLAGGIFTLFFGSSAYLKNLLTRAMGESPLMFFIVLATLFCILGIHRYRRQLALNSTNGSHFKTYVLFLLSGISCGLAGASKINGLVACVGVTILIISEIFLFSPQLKNDQKIILSIRYIFVIASGALITFIIVNPYLYTNPITHVGRMYKFRLEEMAIQIAGFPKSHIDSLSDRVKTLIPETFKLYMPFQFPGAIPIFFSQVLLGLAIVIHQYLKKSTGLNHIPAGVIMLPLVIAGYMTPLNWDRYLLPCVMFNMIYAPIGIAALVQWIKDKVVYVYQRKKLPAL